MKNQKGITLIALVITIIVMLILVGVSVTVALNGGLFTTAQDATDRTKTERDNELALSDGKVEINGEWYNSIDEYLNGDKEYAAYSIGDVVTIGTETFYVIEDSDKTQEKVTLITKDSINKDLVQSSATTLVNFCEESAFEYWGTGTDPYDIQEPEPTLDQSTGELTLPASHVAAKAAYDYGAKVGGVGRLMLLEEAEALDTDEYKDILYGTNGKSSKTRLEYWLGTARDTVTVYAVWGEMIDWDSVMFLNEVMYEVRPVVIISKDKV